MKFLKEWGPFILFVLVLGLSRLFLWQPVKVDGHSMDPTLADGERLIVLDHTKINRLILLWLRKLRTDKPRKSLNVSSGCLVIRSLTMMTRFTSTVKKSMKNTLMSTNKPLMTTNSKTFMPIIRSSKSWLRKQTPLLRIAMAILNLPLKCQKASTISWEMTASYRKTAVKSELFRNHPLLAKSNSASGHFQKSDLLNKRTRLEKTLALFLFFL